MSIFQKRNKPEEKKIPITKEPTLDDLAIWYDLKARGFRKRRSCKKCSIINRVLTEEDYGQIFYKCGIPPKLPVELHEWAEALSAAWCRLVPLNAT